LVEKKKKAEPLWGRGKKKKRKREQTWLEDAEARRRSGSVFRVQRKKGPETDSQEEKGWGKGEASGNWGMKKIEGSIKGNKILLPKGGRPNS